MSQNLLITTALCLAATGASAELTYGSAFVKSHNFDSNDGSGDLRTFGGGIEYRTNNFTFSGDIGRIDGEGETDGLDFGSVGVGYTLQNGVTIGLDYSTFSVEDDSTDVISAYAMYSFGAYTVGLSAGDSSDLSDTAYTVFGAWDVSDNGTVGADVIRVEGETGVSAYADYDLDRYSLAVDAYKFDTLRVFAVSGAYDFGNKISIIGSLAGADEDGDGTTALSVGAQYEFVEGANVEFALGRINVDGGDNIDRMTVGLNYEFGKKTSKRRTLSTILVGATSQAFGLTDF